MNTRRVRNTLLTVLVLLGLAALGFVLMPREPLLMERATQAADTRSWIPDWHFYRWIDDHEVLFLRDGAVPTSGETEWTFCRHDTRTGQDTALYALSRLAQGSFDKMSLFAVSPDGKYLCWSANGIIVTTLEGEGSFNVGREKPGEVSAVGWMRDSRHLVAYTTFVDTQSLATGTVYDVTPHRLPQRLNVNASLIAEAISTDYRILAADWTRPQRPNAPRTVEIDVGKVGNENSPGSKYLVHLPSHGTREEAIFSPDGQHIAWPLTNELDRPAPLLAWMHRLIPAFNPPQRLRASLWVSRIDGSQMHEVGCVPIPAEEEVTWEEDLQDVSWLPDSKRLSFRHKDGLYTVPSE